MNKIVLHVLVVSIGSFLTLTSAQAMEEDKVYVNLRHQMGVKKEYEKDWTCKVAEIWNLYLDFAKQEHNHHPMMKISAEWDIEQLSKSPWNEVGNYPELLNNLKIDLSNTQIKDIYKRYSIIQLRPIDPSCTKLLIGCGNNPVLNYEVGHNHKGMITINPEISMNPTIIGGFGVHDLRDILPYQHFSALVEESVNPIMDTNGMLSQSLRHALRPDAKFYTIQKGKKFHETLQDEDGMDQLREMYEHPLQFLTDTDF